jgi:hypothetical protein
MITNIVISTEAVHSLIVKPRSGETPVFLLNSVRNHHPSRVPHISILKMWAFAKRIVFFSTSRKSKQHS